jgi:hypothetical protein
LGAGFNVGRICTVGICFCLRRHARKDGLLQLGLVSVAELLVIDKAVLLPVLAANLGSCHPLFVCGLSCCVDSGLVGIWAYDHAVVNPRVDFLASKATVASANFTFPLGAPQSTRPVQAIATV